MERIGKIYRSTIENDFKVKLGQVNNFFMIKYAGLKAAELSELRSIISGVKGRMFVTKNSLANRMLKEAQMEKLSALLNGQVAFIFSYDDPISICKAISAFIKEHAALEFGGGLLEKRLIAKSDLEALSKIPSKDVLRAKLVMCIKAPLNNFGFVISGILRKPIYMLMAIKDKKEGQK